MGELNSGFRIRLCHIVVARVTKSLCWMERCGMKTALACLLNSLGLLLPVFRGIEFMQTLGAEIGR